MSTAVSLDRAQQHLIDVRLDSLDRILIDSGVSRSERCEIVQAVEDQIFEMLDQQGEEVTREGVLRLLRSLDPPEAYCSEDAKTDITSWSMRGSRREAFGALQTQSGQQHNAMPPKQSGLAITSFVLAIVSIPTIILFPIGCVFALASLVCGIIALLSIAGSHGRLHGRWMAIFGCTCFGLHAVAAACLLVMMNQ